MGGKSPLIEREEVVLYVKPMHQLLPPPHEFLASSSVVQRVPWPSSLPGSRRPDTMLHWFAGWV